MRADRVGATALRNCKFRIILITKGIFIVLIFATETISATVKKYKTSLKIKTTFLLLI
jgi:hypothetical protein